jgi:hypothetical protein
VLAGIVMEMGPSIEELRIPPEERICWSHRFDPEDDGRLYSQSHTYAAFLSQTRAMLQAPGTTHIIMADIADFYPRLYLHPLENALSRTKRPGHSACLLRMIKYWNANVSYGIPIGPKPLDILAELALDCVDRELLTQGMTFCRYVDDYRIAAKGYSDAYTKLATLANALYETHGLTLQTQKTCILTADEYEERTDALETSEFTVTRERFDQILERYGLGYDPYDPYATPELPPEAQEDLEALDLVGKLETQIKSADLDVPFTQYVLRRLGQLRDRRALAIVQQNTERLYPVFSDVMQYVIRLQLEARSERGIARWLIGALHSSYVSHLPCHRSWILHTLHQTRGRLPSDTVLTALYERFKDEQSRREILIALGKRSMDA